MSRELSVDTQRQNFLIEAINMETFARVQWHEKYYEKTTASNKLRDPAPEQLKEKRLKKLYGMVPQFPKGRIIPTINYPPRGKTKREEIQEEIAFRMDDTNYKPDMKPVASDTKKLLFDGFTKEGKGRHQYLQERKQTIPEKKYEYPLTSGWELGWKQKESNVEFKAPIYGRNRIVRDTFYRTNKIFYDPIPIEIRHLGN